MKKRIGVYIGITIGIALLLMLILEAGVRIVVDLPVKTDFYSSISKEKIPSLQKKIGVKVCSGGSWIHLGWIADPAAGRYSVYRVEAGGETRVGQVKYGSFLIEHLGPHQAYTFRVKSETGDFDHTVKASTGEPESPLLVPYIASPWKPLFKPEKTGSYLNDHGIYKGRDGTWHVVGITSFGDGDYSKEIYFAHGNGPSFPPHDGMFRELERAADFGHLAWAPHVLRTGERYLMWFSPHRCYVASSDDGYLWREERRLEFLPMHPQFRDPMVIQVADGQWLMYATARDGYYSSVDLYQSFDLEHWQYIGAALETGFGCERAGAPGTTESPFVFCHGGRYYLSFTYNNDSFFWNALLLPVHVWLDRESYNDTMIFASANPYSFGTYRGKERPSSLVANIRAHAPEYIESGGKWYVTTAGWPWVATITKGEVAYAELGWKKKK
ncbi:MAG: hypothetical protein KA369_17495 [Spirochaetes bacterium]|nr:hypothetical protein [Spirochaetota bacterium]